MTIISRVFILLHFFFFVGMAFAAPTEALLNPETTVEYARQLSPMLTGKSMSAKDTQDLRNGNVSLRSLLERWTASEYFPQSVRVWIRNSLMVSGQSPSIDFELPGNLAAYLAKNNLGWEQILTADFCVDSRLRKRPCDSGAPFTAGILTTRAFLHANKGRFNLQRAGTWLREFACREYPMEITLQPPLPKDGLLSMFQVNQPTGDSPGQITNGSACYNCHSQFGAHAQLFVKFNASGLYVPSASGLQDPDKESGASFNDLFVSHFARPERASDESSQMFGRSVVNLREAAIAMTDNSAFWQCSARNALRYFLRLEDADASTINSALLAEIAKTVMAKSQRSLSINELVVNSLTHPKVIESVMGSGHHVSKK